MSVGDFVVVMCFCTTDGFPFEYTICCCIVYFLVVMCVLWNVKKMEVSLG